MHVIHSVHSPDKVADSEPRAAPNSHTNDFPGALDDRFESASSLNLVASVASHSRVNVAHQTNLNTLARPVVIPRRNWRANLFVEHRQHRLALIAANVQPAVQVIKRDPVRRAS